MKELDFSKLNRPLRGWSSWNCYGMGIDEAGILKQMKALIDTGLADAGYDYVNIDDGWQNGRDEVTGRIQYNAEKFPHGMKYIADEAHKLGIKAGIYTDGGDNLCGSGSGRRYYGRDVGLWHHEEDLWTYLADGNYADKYSRETGADPVECWGYDFIKVDWCGGRDHNLNTEERYSAYNDVILEIEDKMGKDKNYNICCWGYNGPWMQRVADSWRCGADLDMSGRRFESVINAFEVMKRVGRFSIPGHYCDPDMLIIGKQLTQTQDKSHFTMWCMFSVPLVLGCDITQMNPETLELIKNPELLELNDDPLAKCATCINTLEDTVDLWFKKTKSYEGGDGAIALFNKSSEPVTVTVDLADICVSGKAILRDIIKREDVGEVDKLTITIPGHDTVIYTLKTFDGFTREDFAMVAEGVDYPYSDNQWISHAVAKLYVKNNGALLIDVRTPEEYASGHLDGAINIELTKLIRSPELLPQDKNSHLIVYCAGGPRSRQAHYELRNMGYFNVYDLGDMNDTSDRLDD